ncbi:MAG: hypothetical protein WC900_02735 [Oscillospiraceae bacterium]
MSDIVFCLSWQQKPLLAASCYFPAAYSARQEKKNIKHAYFLEKAQKLFHAEHF